MRRLPKDGVWVKKSPSAWDATGIADILGCWRGRYWAIELKAPGRYAEPEKGLSKAQRRFLANVRRAGGMTLVADSWEAIEVVLASFEPRVVL